MALSLVSLNIEQDKQFERVIPFLREQKPDVTCIQEIFDRDIPLLEDVCGPCISFAPQCYLLRDGILVPEGVAIFSQVPARPLEPRYYMGGPETVRLDDGQSDVGTHVVVGADVGEHFRIFTAHFVWTPHGESTDLQLSSANTIIEILSEYGNHILCGDFNAPRGRETYARFLKNYTDTIPTEYKTSIDVTLHRAGETRPTDFVDKMVDYLFTMPPYSVRDVRLQFGVSDHAAVIATIEKTA